MKDRTFPITVWVLLGILAIAAVSLTLGRNDSSTFPSASSYSPSGTKAFADLLTRMGYRVSITQATKPVVKRDHILIAYAQNSAFRSSTARKFIEDFVEAGGKAIVFSVPTLFPKAQLNTLADSATDSDTANVIGINNASDTTRIDHVGSGLAYSPPNRQNSYTVAEAEDGTPLASLQHIDRGDLLAVSDGIVTTNRFIDRNSNASELIKWVQTIAPPGSSLVFYEASFGHNTDPGILELIGTWALAAWWQLIFLFIVIVYTLGKPFGYPDEERPKQGGARELVDAVAQTYRRAQATHVALRSMIKEADSEIRKKLKLPLDAPRQSRDQLLPPALAQALANAQVASSDRIGMYDALGIARKLDEELASFMGQRVVRYRRRKYS